MAIEHPKDADVAAEIILTEVIPSISKKLLKATHQQDMSPRVLIDLGVFTYYVYLHAFPDHTTLLALKLFTEIFLMTFWIVS